MDMGYPCWNMAYARHNFSADIRNAFCMDIREIQKFTFNYAWNNLFNKLYNIAVGWFHNSDFCD